MGEVVIAQFGKAGAKRFGMTAKQRKALAFIQASVLESGRWPSMHEVAEHIGVKSAIGVRFVVRQLADAGHVAVPEGVLA